jgi:hypothetical protein
MAKEKKVETGVVSEPEKPVVVENKPVAAPTPVVSAEAKRIAVLELKLNLLMKHLQLKFKENAGEYLVIH